MELFFVFISILLMDFCFYDIIYAVARTLEIRAMWLHHLPNGGWYF